MRQPIPVNLYTLKGEYILTADSMSDLAILLNSTPSDVSKALKGGTIKGYQVRKYKEPIYDIAPAKCFFETRYKVFELKTRHNEIVARFDCPEEISTAYGISLNTVNKAIKFKTLLLHKYKVVEAIERITNNKNEFL